MVKSIEDTISREQKIELLKEILHETKKALVACEIADKYIARLKLKSSISPDILKEVRDSEQVNKIKKSSLTDKIQLVETSIMEELEKLEKEV